MKTELVVKVAFKEVAVTLDGYAPLVDHLKKAIEVASKDFNKVATVL